MRKPQTAIITGASSGLGLEAAKDLLRSPHTGWTIVVAARDVARGEAAVAELNQQAGRTVAAFRRLDLGNFADIRRFAADFKAENLPPLGALVCNAGLQFLHSEARTSDGVEATFGVNHLGHFLLIHTLLEAVADQGRIVIVGSGTHDPAQKTGMPAPCFIDPLKLALPECDVEQAFAEDSESPALVGRRRYTTSKLCNILCAYELDRRLHEQRGITVTAFDPGLMPGTGLARDYGGLQRFAWNTLLPVLRPLINVTMGNVNSPEQSGHALARLVDAPELAGVSGKYFEGRREIRSSEESYDRTKARHLWEVSERLVGLAGTEKISGQCKNVAEAACA